METEKRNLQSIIFELSKMVNQLEMINSDLRSAVTTKEFVMDYLNECRRINQIENAVLEAIISLHDIDKNEQEHNRFVAMQKGC